MREKKVISKGYDKNHYTEYKKKWAEIEILKPWLRPFPQNNKKAYCIMCKRDFVAKLATLKHHATTDTHKENRKIFLNLDDEPLEDIEKDIAYAELKLTAYAIVTNQSKLSCNTLVPLMASIFKDSSIAKEIRLDRCRVGEITKRVLAPAHKDRLRSILQKQKFSIIVDESTDISTTHCLAVVVRYVDFDLQKIDERLGSLIHLYSDPLNNETSAEVLFELIMESFQSEDVPTKSIYGYCSDTCNVMMGRNNSVASRFKSYNPQIFINKCQCHIQHLSAKHAYECLPQQFMELLTNIPTYIRASPRRMTMFRWLQKGANLKELKPIYPSMTRWLATWNQKKTKAGKEIFALLQQPQTKIYYQFLEFILVKFNKTNASLQSISPIVTNENTRIRNLLLEILEFFINEDYISKYKENLYDIDLKDESQWLPLNSVNIGKFAYESIFMKNLLNDDEKKRLLQHCQKFYVTCCTLLQDKLDLHEEFTTSLKSFHPGNSLSTTYHRRNSNLNATIKTCPMSVSDSDAEVINAQWKLLLKYKSLLPEEIILEKKVDIFWIKLLNCLDENDMPLFSELSNFALLCFVCVANLNASAERVWSQMNLTKTKIRNRLEFESLQSHLYAAEYIKSQGSLFTFEPSEEMLKKTMKIKSRYKKNPSIKKVENEFVQSYYSFSNDYIKQCKLENIWHQQRPKLKYISKNMRNLEEKEKILLDQFSEFLSQGNELMETNENILLLKNEVNITNNNLADYADHDHNYCKMIVDYDSCDNMSVKSGADNNDSEYDSVLSNSILIEQELQEKRFDDENVLLEKSIMNDQVEKVVSFSDNEFENSVLSDSSLFEQEPQEKSYIDESVLKEQSIMDDEIEDIMRFAIKKGRLLKLLNNVNVCEQINLDFLQPNAKTSNGTYLLKVLKPKKESFLTFSRAAERHNDDVKQRFLSMYVPNSDKQNFSWHRDCYANYTTGNRTSCSEDSRQQMVIEETSANNRPSTSGSSNAASRLSRQRQAIPYGPTTHDTVYTSMKTFSSLSESYGKQYSILTADMAIYLKSKMIQMQSPNPLPKLFMRIGTLTEDMDSMFGSIFRRLWNRGHYFN
ncbi:hypothetical protein TKK_0005864 [Trichogramma kaykai]